MIALVIIPFGLLAFWIVSRGQRSISRSVAELHVAVVERNAFLAELDEAADR